MQPSENSSFPASAFLSNHSNIFSLKLDEGPSESIQRRRMWKHPRKDHGVLRCKGREDRSPQRLCACSRQVFLHTNSECFLLNENALNISNSEMRYCRTGDQTKSPVYVRQHSAMKHIHLTYLFV